MIVRLAAMSLVLAAAAPARAEIETSPKAFCDSAPAAACVNRWPKLTLPQGWQQDQPYSLETGVNHLYYEPDPTHGNIYAGMESAGGKAATVDSFIADDTASFTDYRIKEGPLFLTVDGQVLQSRLFTPKTGGDPFEIVAYGEENDTDGQRYYLTFVLTTPDQGQQDVYFAAFKAILEAYHK